MRGLGGLIKTPNGADAWRFINQSNAFYNLMAAE